MVFVPVAMLIGASAGLGSLGISTGSTLRARDSDSAQSVFVATSSNSWTCLDCASAKSKRDVSLAPKAAVFGVNTANLRGKDLKRLKGIMLNIYTPDNVVIVGPGFSAQGSMQLEQGNSEYVHGNLSFHIPGLDAPAEGSFITVNETVAETKTKKNFEKVVAHLQEDRLEPDLSEVIRAIAATI